MKDGLPQFLDKLIELAGRAFGWSYTWFLLVDRDDEVVTLKVISGSTVVHGYTWTAPFIARYRVDAGHDDIVKEGIIHIAEKIGLDVEV